MVTYVIDDASLLRVLRPAPRWPASWRDGRRSPQAAPGETTFVDAVQLVHQHEHAQRPARRGTGSTGWSSRNWPVLAPLGLSWVMQGVWLALRRSDDDRLCGRP